MKRQILALWVVLILAACAALMAQSTTPNTQVPPSQQVDQSGQPEHAGRPDVDVDVGKNAKNGVLNVDVKRHGDSDTKAGNNPNGNRTTTTTGTTGTYTGTTTSTGASTATTTRHTRHAATHVRHRMHHAASKHHRLPKTGSDMPLAGLLGALSLAGALALRKLQ